MLYALNFYRSVCQLCLNNTKKIISETSSIGIECIKLVFKSNKLSHLKNKKKTQILSFGSHVSKNVSCESL